MSEQFIKPVALEKGYRLLNVGGTALVSASFEGDLDLMPATWVGALNLDPFRCTAIIDSTHYTRRLMEQSGMFSLQLPTLFNIEPTMYLGAVSKNDEPDKVKKSGIELFYMDGYDLPLARGCAAWMIFKILKEPENERKYDLFIGECVAAWADERVFKDGHWQFEKADPKFSTIHYVAGNHFYTMGQPHYTKLSIEG
ncbi:MAG: flavin reductase family protein [Succinivibrio sp.]|nr:flavin reductase family protein [Succinivibrio sp.]